MDTETGNRAIKDGSLARRQTLESAIQTLPPEAAYFVADEGKRTG